MVEVSLRMEAVCFSEIRYLHTDPHPRRTAFVIFTTARTSYLFLYSKFKVIVLWRYAGVQKAFSIKFVAVSSRNQQIFGSVGLLISFNIAKDLDAICFCIYRLFIFDIRVTSYARKLTILFKGNKNFVY